MARHLVLVLGDQLDLEASAFDSFDPAQDAVWMAEVDEESTHVWSSKQRIALFLALGALALFYVLLFPTPAPRSEPPTRPQSTESGVNGYLALSRWLDASGVTGRKQSRSKYGTKSK